MEKHKTATDRSGEKPDAPRDAMQPNPEAAIVQSLHQDRQQALAQFFQSQQDRLKRIVRFRLDYRLSSRVSESDVLQEAYVRASRHLDSFLDQPNMPLFVWIRLELQQMLKDIHRHHLQAEKRDARRELSLNEPMAGCDTSMAIAAHIVAQVTSPSGLIQRIEQINTLRETLDQLPELDREVIALRHFEELSNLETAHYLNIEPSAASKRYLRALKRLKEIMTMVSGDGQ